MTKRKIMMVRLMILMRKMISRMLMKRKMMVTMMMTRESSSPFICSFN